MDFTRNENVSDIFGLPCWLRPRWNKSRVTRVSISDAQNYWLPARSRCLSCCCWVTAAPLTPRNGAESCIWVYHHPSLMCTLCLHRRHLGRLMEKSVGAYLRYWNNSLFFQTLGTRKGWEIGGPSLGGKKKDLRRPWKTKLWAGWDFKSSRSIWTRGFFLSRLVKDSSCAF